MGRTGEMRTESRSSAGSGRTRGAGFKRAVVCGLALLLTVLQISPVYAAGTGSLTKAEKNSSYGFFVWLSENASTANEKKDAAIAAQILKNKVSEENKSQVFNQGNIIGGSGTITYSKLLASMELGADDDATSIANLRSAVDYIKSGNAYRAKESLPALKVSSALMAMAELNVDYQDINGGANHFDHSNVFWAMENLAYIGVGGTWEYGSFGGLEDDPYNGWYTEEKKNFDTSNGGETGHYKTLTDRMGKMLITGFGVRHRYVNSKIKASDNNYYDAQMHDKYYSQTFSTRSMMYSAGTGTTPDDYLKYIDKYIETAAGGTVTDTGSAGSETSQNAGGTALGKGASAAAAEKAIMALKNDNDPAGSAFAPLMLKSVKQGSKNIVLRWTKTKGAKKYVIYGNACGKKNKFRKLATVKTPTYNVKKIQKKALNKSAYYKFMVVALDSNNNVVSTSKVIHVAPRGGLSGNYNSVTVSKSILTKAKALKKGKSLKLGAKAVAKSKILKVRKHCAVRYESSDPKVATVNKSGKLTAKKKGKCKVYAYAQNGVVKVINVVVK